MTQQFLTAGTSVNRSFLKGSHGQSENVQFHSRALLMPDEVRRLPPNNVIVLEQGKPAQLLARLNYLTDPEYQGLFDDNPGYCEQVPADRAPTGPPKPGN